jgi:N6-L-threonylcarbamoyladenine synthase
MKILGIETSCDETGIGLYDSDTKQVFHTLYSQINIHKEFGGIIPEIASRDHVKKILPLFQELLANSGCKIDEIDAIAYTAGPGLIGALLVGATFAESLGLVLKIPVLEVNHIEAHILAIMLENERPSFPFIALLISGGHTMLVKVNNIGDYIILGKTLDDACGECFDKCARVLGMSYPGGAELSKLAMLGDPKRLILPKPMLNKNNLDFSFSGLKTAMNILWSKLSQDEKDKKDIARTLEDTIVEVLKTKCSMALEWENINQLVIAGGVAANTKIRKTLGELMQSMGGHFFCPRLDFCTDNAAMIAYAGYAQFKNHLFIPKDDHSINVYPKMPLRSSQNSAAKIDLN